MLHRVLCVLVLLAVLPGCASMVSSATSRLADNISLAILNQDDPQTVRDGAPSYLILVDGLIAGDEDSVSLNLAGAKLYGSYASAFVDDELRASRLANKAFSYARQALCRHQSQSCDLHLLKDETFDDALNSLDVDDLPVLYGFATAWAGWIQANSSDWNAIAGLTSLKQTFARCIELDPAYDQGGAYLYLGVLEAQVPPSLGGKPDLARSHFEQAIELSSGRNLMVNVLMAEYYARLVFDQELHDQLLVAVGEAEASYPGLTMINTLAKERAIELLAESDDFF